MFFLILSERGFFLIEVRGCRELFEYFCEGLISILRFGGATEKLKSERDRKS